MYDQFHSVLEVKFYKEVTEAMNRSADDAIVHIQGRSLDILEKSVAFDKKHNLHSDAEELLNAHKRIAEIKLSEQQLKDFRRIIKDAIYGAVHSIFVTIDGGTALSTEGTALDLINVKTKESITKGALHESFMSFDPENEK